MAETLTDRPATGQGGAPLLTVRGLQAWYGESHVLHGVDIDIHAGEVVTLLGRNGAGKTTTLRSIMGVVGRRSGSITYGGRELVDARSDVIARAGIAWCPEERGIFASLDVTENLMLPPVKAARRPADRGNLHATPNLKERAQPGQSCRRRAADARHRTHPAHRAKLLPENLPKARPGHRPRWPHHPR